MKNWPGKFARACGITSLLACATAAQPAAAKHPAIALADPSDAEQWQILVKALDWLVIAPPRDAKAGIDARVQALSAAVADAIQKSDADPARIYLAGRGDYAALVFYAIARMPDLWAAGIALGGSPVPAIDTNRVFATNFSNAPVLWVSAAPEAEAFAGKLKTLGLNVEWRSATGLTNGAVLDWMNRHARDEFPASIDCETDSPSVGRCYWIQMTKFDAAERNDVLPSTRLAGASGAFLDVGDFSYKLTDPGPGVLVASLPAKYSGPLKTGDRIVELDGRPIENPRQFADTMGKKTREDRVVIMVQRGKDRMRVETRIVVPQRDSTVTARVQAKYVAEDNHIEIVSRTVTEMRVTIPQHWVPVSLYWNGLSLEDIAKPGCMLLSIDKEILHAAACP
ncbi:MAG TPA: PDZ domain-containing protein [Candidatus Sulfopaludibacter sp.]|nr:PDZ domain-containing protein [Candidatus Sulfopaludibacter sp.]